MTQHLNAAVGYGKHAKCSVAREARTAYPLRLVSKALRSARQQPAHAAIEGSRQSVPSNHNLPRTPVIRGSSFRAKLKASISEGSVTDEGRTACSSSADSSWLDRMPQAEVLMLDATSIACQALGDPTTFCAFISFLEAVVQPVITIAIFDPETVRYFTTRGIKNLL